MPLSETVCNGKTAICSLCQYHYCLPFTPTAIGVIQIVLHLRLLLIRGQRTDKKHSWLRGRVTIPRRQGYEPCLKAISPRDINRIFNFNNAESFNCVPNFDLLLFGFCGESGNRTHATIYGTQDFSCANWPSVDLSPFGRALLAISLRLSRFLAVQLVMIQHLAYRLGLEPRLSVLETDRLPLSYRHMLAVISYRHVEVFIYYTSEDIYRYCGGDGGYRPRFRNVLLRVLRPVDTFTSPFL